MYLARSLPGIRLHTRSKAVRAELTARSTSAGPARATSLSDSSDAGLTVVKTRPSAARAGAPVTRTRCAPRPGGADARADGLRVTTFSPRVAAEEGDEPVAGACERRHGHRGREQRPAR